VEEFFIALVPITLFLTVGGVLVLRPLTKRLGLLVEASARAKGVNAEEQLQLEQLRLLVETQNLKIERMEQKVAFTESLLEARTAGFLPARPAGAPSREM
jgi:uncharacterized membrane protein